MSNPVIKSARKPPVNASGIVNIIMNDYKLPNSCSIDYAGTDEMTMEAVSQLMLMLLLGIILIYLIMVAQFQSLKSPFIADFTLFETDVSV